MKIYEGIKCSRMALGLTQAEYAKIVGVSASTISGFESGREVSEPVFVTIKEGIRKHVAAMNAEQYFEYQVARRIYALKYAQTVEEKKTQYNWIAMFCAKANIELK